MSRVANRGQWSESYAAMRIVADRKLYVADRDGKKNEDEWMSLIELIRHETTKRVVKYRYSCDETDVVISVDSKVIKTVKVSDFDKVAKELIKEIQSAKTSPFSLTSDLDHKLFDLEVQKTKAQGQSKDDLTLSIRDPRSGVTRRNIGFSIKSEIGSPPTLFNAARASAAEFLLPGFSSADAERINSIVSAKGKRLVRDRWLAINGLCSPKFIGFRYSRKMGCRPFNENLELINPRLVNVLAFILDAIFAKRCESMRISDIAEFLTKENPLKLNRPAEKYSYMLKNFLYASYCGLTATKFWDGLSEVNGGFIRISPQGEVLAFYALESDKFKQYLYDNCYLTTPSTSETHGDYGEVFTDELGRFMFRLNFQIRYALR